LMDVQEALELLQFRLGSEVSFRPLGVRGGVLVYRVDGRVLTEREVLAWAASLGVGGMPMATGVGGRRDRLSSFLRAGSKLNVSSLR